MPEISRFLGIIISIFYEDHNPPHFHARYSNYKITVNIMDGKCDGYFPPRALKHVEEWRLLHKEELLENWNSAIKKLPLKPIAPLE